MQSRDSNVQVAKSAFNLKKFEWRNYIVYLAFFGVFIYFSVLLFDDGFLTSGNLLNIVRQTTTITLMALAMTFVISTGEIDLSVGSITALSSLAGALALESGLGIVGGFVAGVGTGVIVGLINGLLVTKVAIPSFLVTLGTMGAVKGVAMWITGTAPVAIVDTKFNYVFGSGDIGLIPILLIWTIIFAVIAHILLRKTSFGRQVLATGGNENAARFSGVKTMKIKLLVFLGTGFMAGLAGLLYAGRMNAGRFSFGEGDELSVIAAVILGGTSLFGGVGTVIGTVVGSLMIGTINNGLIIMGLDVSQQMIIKGLIIILAVAFGKKALKK
ncbi:MULTISPECIES: ABC transporter permease [unclassified Paenibacillus]|uniref:ABC transporter permease n=1 Tax=unclassified Paenibacillus TaxID=185978 RepID=UPI0024068748|nr:MULTISPECIES: ABC transporter permease [unclassified Paenibacillus]MDF9841732.1 ribose transport system permease protein [Paenibacillus sp. PastF-2]MDF9848156.1 ribose transport system permease protein [Paenibacillus sp. PastM-2]MDF9854891.1 ribose transport system permease protein [Paenibacillus sp. PastF-1]MDH6480161.1 ribose transport system permease protein [Paenibacillus sp. PastH-2]MDH6507591.1 ribose transport system permease protein [Paenibacillus sp. PastM-3]